jgi:predicted phage tail protein
MKEDETEYRITTKGRIAIALMREVKADMKKVTEIMKAIEKEAPGIWDRLKEGK